MRARAGRGGSSVAEEPSARQAGGRSGGGGGGDADEVGGGESHGGRGLEWSGVRVGARPLGLWKRRSDNDVRLLFIFFFYGPLERAHLSHIIGP